MTDELDKNTNEEAPAEQADAAKLSDEAAAAAARSFLGTPAPAEEVVTSEEAKSVLRRAGAVAEADAPAPLPEPAPEPVAAATSVPPQTEGDGRRWYVIHTYSGYENKV